MGFINQKTLFAWKKHVEFHIHTSEYDIGYNKKIQWNFPSALNPMYRSVVFRMPTHMVL